MSGPSGGIGGLPPTLASALTCCFDCPDEIMFGLFADRPAAGDVEPGTFYVATDTGNVYVSDGVTWYFVGPGGGGGSFPLTSPQVNVTTDPYVALLSNALYTLSVQVTDFQLTTGVLDTDVIIIKDYTGNATAAPHTINATGGNTIDHVASYPLNGDDDSVMFAFNPVDANWMVL